MTRAREIMETDIITVTPETPLLQAQRLFLESEINGAPVVDESGNLVGVVSSLDLVRAVQEGYDTGAAYTDPIYFRHDMEFSGPDWQNSPEDLQDRLADMTVDDIMVTELVTVSPDADVAEVARTMRDQRVHRVLVVDGDRLAGLITTFDLIELIATREVERREAPAPAHRPDAG